MTRKQFSDEKRELLRFTGQRIKEAREEAGLSQSQLSAALGFGQSWVSVIEGGRNGIDAHDLARVAEITGYPVEFFLDPEWEPRVVRHLQNRADWEAALGDKDRAQIHYDLDRRLRDRPSPHSARVRRTGERVFLTAGAA